MLDMSWTDSATLIERLTDEQFLKYSKGDPKVEFTIPINWVDILDIFTNFRLQQPFGLDGDESKPPEERGEYGRYYYIESLSYDFMNQKISIVGIDLQYLIGQCMIVPHCESVSEDWAGASESDKMYAYVGDCTEGKFADGSPLKRVCECVAPTADLCMIVAHAGEVAEKWEDASTFDRVYAYVGSCAANSFVSDGSPLKQVCTC